MKGSQILDRANFIVGDEIDPIEALAIINLGINDLSIEAPFEDTAALSLSEGVRYVSLPSGFLELIEARINAGELRAAKSPFSIAVTDTGTPYSFYITGADKLNLYPLADDNYTVDILYTNSYTELTSLDGTPDVPVKYHMALVYWLAMNFKISDDEDESSPEKNYYRYRTALKLYQQNRSLYSETREG